MTIATQPRKLAARGALAVLVGVAAVFAALFLSPFWFVVVVAIAAWNVVRLVRQAMAEPAIPIASSAVLIGINIALVLFVAGWLMTTLLFSP
ncbi:hypothetical protein [Agreia bicolorata]|uniref:AI-2E family transporter n=1 Tax=Agreia bicolorata TaxID=110935 RepID=A0ABR5CFE8_9MICO|nr:hypothetical protein [Agreia bicolorata]KJC64330.1 hypothetical protein TZ00_07685 [Agreia bicolorata]